MASLSGIYNSAKNVYNNLGYGVGNWNTPELGITEKLGGNKSSIKTATTNKNNYNVLGASTVGNTQTVAPKQSVAPTQTKAAASDLQPKSTSSTSKSSSGNSGGGGSSSSGVSVINPVTGEEQMYDKESAAINGLYSDSERYLNEQYKNAIAGEQDYYKTFTTPYETQLPELQATLTNEAGQRDMAINSAKQTEQTALSEARRLYNELLQRNNQQFGGVGGSSAGQASGEIAARELQRNSGSIQRQTTDQINSLNKQYSDFENTVNSQIRELNLQKDLALAQAKEAFRQRLDQINSAKAELGVNKANAKLNLMQQFRQRVQQINDTVSSQQFQLEAQRQSAQLSLSNQIAAMNKQAELTGYNTNIDTTDATNYSSIGTGQNNGGNSLVGYVGNSGRNKDQFSYLG